LNVKLLIIYKFKIFYLPYFIYTSIYSI